MKECIDPFFTLEDDISELIALQAKLKKANDAENENMVASLLIELEEFKTLIMKIRNTTRVLAIENLNFENAIDNLRKSIALESDPIDVEIDLRMELMNKMYR